MQGALKERWFDLCAQAMIEQDPERLVQLAHEINRLLEEKRAASTNSKGQISRAANYLRPTLDLGFLRPTGNPDHPSNQA